MTGKIPVLSVDLSHEGLLELLEALCLSRQLMTVEVTDSSGALEGAVWIKSGQLLRVTAGARHGLDALAYLSTAQGDATVYRSSTPLESDARPWLSLADATEQLRQLRPERPLHETIAPPRHAVLVPQPPPSVPAVPIAPPDMFNTTAVPASPTDSVPLPVTARTPVPSSVVPVTRSAEVASPVVRTPVPSSAVPVTRSAALTPVPSRAPTPVPSALTAVASAVTAVPLSASAMPLSPSSYVRTPVPARRAPVQPLRAASGDLASTLATAAGQLHKTLSTNSSAESLASTQPVTRSVGTTATTRLATAARPTGPMLTVFSNKGGVGKTTLAINLAVALARRNLRVVLVDTDPRNDLGNALASKRDTSRGVYDVIDGACSLDQVMLESALPGLRMLPAGGARLDEARFQAASSAGDALRGLLAGLTNPHTIVVVDTPPGLRGIPHHALRASTHALCVVQAEPIALRAAAAVPASLQSIDSSERPALVSVVLNMLDRRVPSSLGMLEDACALFGADAVFDLPIPRSGVFVEASEKGAPLAMLDPSSGHALGFLFDSLASTVLARMGVTSPKFVEGGLL